MHDAATINLLDNVDAESTLSNRFLVVSCCFSIKIATIYYFPIGIIQCFETHRQESPPGCTGSLRRIGRCARDSRLRYEAEAGQGTSAHSPAALRWSEEVVAAQNEEVGSGLLWEP